MPIIVFRVSHHSSLRCCNEYPITASHRSLINECQRYCATKCSQTLVNEGTIQEVTLLCPQSSLRLLHILFKTPHSYRNLNLRSSTVVQYSYVAFSVLCTIASTTVLQECSASNAPAPAPNVDCSSANASAEAPVRSQCTRSPASASRTSTVASCVRAGSFSNANSVPSSSSLLTAAQNTE